MEAAEKILRAADELFGEVGFDAATTREIADRSGVNKALIHYHYRSKEGLFEKLLDRYYAQLSTTLRDALEVAQGSLRDRLVLLLDTYVDFLVANRNFGRIVQREASGGLHMERIQAHMVPLFDLGMSAIRLAYPSTVSGELAAEQLFTSFYGMIISTFTYSGVVQHLTGQDPLSSSSLEARKKHLLKMLDITLQALPENA